MIYIPPNTKLPDIIESSPSNIERLLLTEIYARRFSDLNFFFTSYGRPGSGKSTSMIKLFSKLQVDPKTLEPNFVPEEQIVFTSSDFIKFIAKTDPIKEPGKCIGFDEIELEVNSKGWDRVAHRMSLVVSTERYKLNIIGASLPMEKQLLKSVRSLRDAALKTNFVNHYNNKIYAKYYHLDYDQTADTVKYRTNVDAKRYFPRFYVWKNNHRYKYVMDQLVISKPPEKIITAYKKMKVEFLKGYYETRIRELDKEDASLKTTDLSFNKFCEFIDKHKDRFIFNNKLEPIMVASALKISDTRSKEYCRAYLREKEIKMIKSKEYVD
jgi:hypothetical protein